MNNMYPEVEVGCNFLCGECTHQCIYCSTKSLGYEACKIKYAGPYRLVNNFENIKLGTGHFYFICSQSDLFANEVPEEFIIKILAKCREFKNKYMFQTKNPYRFFEFTEQLPRNVFLGTTIESDKDDPKLSKAPKVSLRAEAMGQLYDFATFLTIEPICEFNLERLLDLINHCGPDKIYIGADSKKHDLPEPSKEEALELIGILESTGFNLELKSNLERIIGKEEMGLSNPPHAEANLQRKDGA